MRSRDANRLCIHAWLQSIVIEYTCNRIHKLQFRWRKGKYRFDFFFGDSWKGRHRLWWAMLYVRWWSNDSTILNSSDLVTEVCLQQPVIEPHLLTGIESTFTCTSTLQRSVFVVQKSMNLSRNERRRMQIEPLPPLRRGIRHSLTDANDNVFLVQTIRRLRIIRPIASRQTPRGSKADLARLTSGCGWNFPVNQLQQQPVADFECSRSAPN